MEGSIGKEVPPATNMDLSSGGGRGLESDSGVGTSNVTSTDRLTPFSDMTVFSGGGDAINPTLPTEVDQGQSCSVVFCCVGMYACVCVYACMYLFSMYACVCVCMHVSV